MNQMDLHRHLISVLDEQTRQLENKIAQMGPRSSVADDVRFKLAVVKDSLRRVHGVQQALEEELTRERAAILAYEVKTMSQRCDELKISIKDQMPTMSYPEAVQVLN